MLFLRSLLGLLGFVGLTQGAAAIAAPRAIAQSSWQDPPEPIAEMIDAPQLPGTIISPDSRWLIRVERPSYPPIEELTKPVLGLAGLEIDPQTHSPAKAYSFRGMTLQAISEAGVSPPQPIALPDNARIRHFDWSPDGNYLAFTLTRENGVELWVLEVETATSRPLTEAVLNATYGSPCDWVLPNAEAPHGFATQGLVCKVIPGNLGEPPAAPAQIPAPRVEESLGRQAPARTYTNLLESPHDEALFEYYLTSELHHISLDGTHTPLTEPLLIDEVTPSPDGQWFLLKTLQRPFSYSVPIQRFPKRVEVLNGAGERVSTIADLPLADSIPIEFGSVRAGRRWVNWRSDQPATLYWIEALDGGDARQEVPLRDALYTVDLPTGADAETLADIVQNPTLVWQTEFRLSRLMWGNETRAIAHEFWPDTRQLRVWAINPSDSSESPVLLSDRNSQDAYNHPGTPVMVQNGYGRRTLLFAPDQTSIYLTGRGASPEGVFPFLDRLSLETQETERLWQAQSPYYEQVSAVVDAEAQQIITRRQSTAEPPNYFLQDLSAETAVQLSQYEDPLPWFSEVDRQVIRYQRADGLELSGTLFLPPGTEAGDRLPTVFWVYPEEHRSRETASQVTTSDYGFSRPYYASVMYLLTQGYAVFLDPSMPIVGEGDDEPNDSYIEQLVMSAKAAVDCLVSEGIADPNQLVIGGHSYGAFTVANLLAHTDLFQVGIARSGAYNRTLTPFGFQGEQRNFWDAPDTYLSMSPFSYASAIDTPLLLLHGAEDNNSGTYPMQSERMFEALKGLGGTVRWVELPHEGHNYESREAIGHVLWEMTQWIERYLAPDSASSSVPTLDTLDSQTSAPDSAE